MSEAEPTSPPLRSKKARDIEAGDVLRRLDNPAVRRKVANVVRGDDVIHVWLSDGGFFCLRYEDSVFVEFREGTAQP
jgi:hypothetical protein